MAAMAGGGNGVLQGTRSGPGEPMTGTGTTAGSGSAARTGTPGTAGPSGAGKLRPLTVRLSADAAAAIRDAAADSGVSQAELVRLALLGNLEKYLGTVRIMDYEQAEEIRALIASLMDNVSRIYTELDMIGRKLGWGAPDLPGSRDARDARNALIGKEEESGMMRDLESLMIRYERATGKVGDILCRYLA